MSKLEKIIRALEAAHEIDAGELMLHPSHRRFLASILKSLDRKLRKQKLEA